MPPQNTQVTPEEAKGALGFITAMSHKMSIPQESPETPTETAPETPQDAPQPKETPEPQENVGQKIQELEGRLMGELTSLKEQIATQGDAKQEVEKLKKQIEEVLNE